MERLLIIKSYQNISTEFGIYNDFSMTTTTVKTDHRGDACRTVLLSFYFALDDKHNLMIHYYCCCCCDYIS